MIDVRGLKKRFGTTQAISNISFHAANGTITGLLGANGAGKTTTLRIISGLLKPDQGVIRIDEADPCESHRHHTRLGTLLDHTGLYPRLTAQENLAYFARLQGLTVSQAEQRAAKVLASLGIQSLAHKRVAGFSLGQRSKVALGRAIVHSPENLLLDEPTNGLDVPTVRALRALLRDRRDAGCCIVFSSHVLDEVEQVCDKIVIISGGNVAASGSPEEIRRQAAATSLEDAFMKLTETPRVQYA